MREFKKGDIVKVKNRRGPGWNSAGEMDVWMGKVVKLKEAGRGRLNCVIADDPRWSWNYYDFEKASNEEIAEYQKEHVCEIQITTRAKKNFFDSLF